MKTLRVIRFTIPVTPQSVQHGSRHGRGHFYSDPKKKKYIDSIIAESKHHAPDKPHHGPVAVSMSFYLERPSWITSPVALPAWQIRGIDDDNIYKGTKDALTKAGYWMDDSQICQSHLSMWWHEEGLFPRIEVSITLFDVEPDNCPPAIKKLLKERAVEGP